MYSKAQLYWIKYDLQDLAVMIWLLPLGAFVVIIAAPLWAEIAKHTSKRAAMITGAALNFSGFWFFT
jgi:hypothetical protein